MEIILKIIYIKLKDKKWIKCVFLWEEKILLFFIFFEYKNIYNEEIKIYLDVKKLFYMILSLIFFIIFYLCNIKLLSSNFMYYYLMYLSIFFFFFLWIMFYNLIKGFSLKIIGKKNNKNMEKCLIQLLNLLVFIVNICVIKYIFDINFEESLQYNLWFIIDNFVYIYNLLCRKKKGLKINNFIYYPYIYIMIILLLCKYIKNLKNINYLKGYLIIK